MRKRIILLIALLTVVLAFASCKNKTKYTVSVKLAEGEQLIGSITTEVGKKALIGDVINETSVQKEGHIFKGWSIDGSSLVDKQLVVTENILLIPLFEVNSYKIKYTIDGEVFSEELLKYGSKIEVKQVPEKTGYTFKGWFVQGDEGRTVIDLSTYKFTEDTVLVAVFTDSEGNEVW